MDRLVEPGINYVGWIEPENVPYQLVSKALSGELPGIYGKTHPVEAWGATLTIEREWENGGMVETAKLKFITTDELRAAEESNAVWIVRTNSGEILAIGSRQRPYAKIERERTTGEAGGDSAATSVTVQAVGLMAAVSVALLDR